MRGCAIPVLFLLLVTAVQAEEPVYAAVASNFVPTFTELAIAFKSKTGIHVVGSSGSTGKLYAQIVNGAKFDIYLAADAERPASLADLGHAVAETRFTYALGRIVVWSNSADDCLAALQDPDAGYIALANPVTAPYGKAARQFLEAVGAWNTERNILGTNVAQAAMFAATGNVVISIISRSQLYSPFMPEASCTYDISPAIHDPIEQQAVLLDANNDGARRFLEFLRSDEARQTIEQDGYEVSQ